MCAVEAGIHSSMNGRKLHGSVTPKEASVVSTYAVSTIINKRVLQLAQGFDSPHKRIYSVFILIHTEIYFSKFNFNVN